MGAAMRNEVIDLAARKCKPCEGEAAPLDAWHIEAFLKGVPGWSCDDHTIHKTYLFEDYYKTMAFVNAVAWIAHTENHHPDLIVGYNSCCVKFWTHAIAGLSENDFICAAKVDALLGL